jgi:hypothetical protein
MDRIVIKLPLTLQKPTDQICPTYREEETKGSGVIS